MAAFNYGNNTATGMNSTGMVGDQSNFDSSGMNYDSGMGVSTPQFDTGQNNLPRDNSGGSTGVTAPVQPTPTDGTLLGTVAPKPGTNLGYNLQGFNTDKFNNQSYSSGKYTPAARNFYNFMNTGGALEGGIGRNNLSGAVNYARINGFPNAQAVGDDKIDYGDGNGPIDAVQSNGSIWFQNGQDRFAQPNQQQNGSMLGISTLPADTRTYAQPLTGQTNTNPDANQFAQLMQLLFNSGQMNQQPNNITMSGGGFTGLGPQQNNTSYGMSS